MKAYLGENNLSPRPGCPCCTMKYMHGYRPKGGHSVSVKNVKRSGKKVVRRKVRQYLAEWCY